jgi:predicted DsbA family dithiol-disulfide isomerase
MKTKILATSATCGPCFTLKARIEKEKLEVEIKDYTNPENIEWFKKHGIRAVPRLVIEDGDNVEIIQGIEEIIEALKK